MINRYTLGDQLGKGGMGTVYQAHDRLENRPVALKRIEVTPILAEFNPLVADARYQHLLLAHEFRILASLRHPNIISVLDYGFGADHTPFFVMELLNAPSTLLEAAVGLSSLQKIDLLLQVLQALVYLHHHRILHRDLKPNNVLVLPGNLVKVLDFGLAVKEGDMQEQAGTIYYMAPEVLNQKPATETSDLYAVGIMAYEMFTGIRPYEGAMYWEAVKQIMFAPLDMTPFDRLAETDPMLLGVSSVIQRLTEKAPEDRYQTAFEVMSALCAVAGQPLPPEEGPIRESFLQAARFVGRDQELEELQWALMETQKGTGGMWLVGGESGIGKSRLLEELRTYALTEGVHVLQGQFSETGPNDTVWHEALRPLTWGLSHDLAAQQHTSPGDLIQTLSESVLLILEDLQCAGDALAPLQQMMPLLKQRPILIIGSFRTDEAPRLPEQLPDAHVILLRALSYQAVAELGSAVLGKDQPHDALIKLILEATDGNAFFIVETLRAWAEEAGRLNQIGQSALPEMVFPEGIRNLVQRRLKRVPDWAYGGLQVAAVTGRRLDLPLLNKILSPILSLMTGEGLSVSVSTIWREARGLTLDDWLLVCADRGILEAQGGTWRFTHDKLREQLLSELSPDQMSMILRQINKAQQALMNT